MSHTILVILMWITLIFTGMIYPLLEICIISLNMNGKYQFSMMRLSREILTQGGEYFAGTPLLYNINQSIPGMVNLIGPAIEYLHHPSKDLLPILIPSLYLTPRTDEQVINDINTRPVKLYVNNSRIDQLPIIIKKYLNSQYLQYWGSIYLYSPEISSDQHTFTIKFSGIYQVVYSSKNRIQIDKYSIKPNQRIVLKSGKHTSYASMIYRLKLIPEKTYLELNPKYKEDSWEEMLKPIII